MSVLAFGASTRAVEVGDIAVIGFNTDNDALTFVALAPIAGGEQIVFTDKGWNSSTNALHTAEGTWTYNVPAAGLNAGTTVNADFSSGISGLFELGNNGDQVLAFQGTVASPTLIYALNFETTDPTTLPSKWQSTGGTTVTSAEPPGLVGAKFALDETDSGVVFGAVLSGGPHTKSEWLALFTNQTNWHRSDSNLTQPTGSIAMTTSAGPLFINELDYDQPGTDDSEFIELVLINGTGGGATPYQTIALPDFILTDETDGYGFYVVSANAANVANTDLDVSPDTNLIQNGAPDAIALLIDGVLVQYLTYEGVAGDFMGTSPNDGGAFLDDDGGLAGFSLQKVGTGLAFGDFGFAHLAATPGAVNTNQTFAAPPPPTGGDETVPEPASALLLLVAGAAMVSRRRTAYTP